MSRKRNQNRTARRALKQGVVATATAATLTNMTPVETQEGSLPLAVRISEDMADPLASGERMQMVSTLPPQKPRGTEESAGTDGLVVYDGRVATNETNRALVGVRRYITYQNIVINTAIVAAGYRFYSNLIRRAGWSMEPGNDTAEAKERKEFVLSVMNGLDDQSWSSVIAQIGTHRYSGFSIQEMVSKTRKDGKVGFAGIYCRPQWTIEEWDRRRDKLIGVIQRDPQTNAQLYMSRRRVIHCVDNSIASGPEGLGLARHLVGPVDTLNGYEKLEKRGFETDLRGTPIGYAPLGQLVAGLDTEEKKKAKLGEVTSSLTNFITNYRNSSDASLVLDSAVQRGRGDQSTPINVSQWRVELLRGDPTTLEPLAMAIERKNREAARILGVEMLLLGGGGGAGGQALAQDKSLAFGLNVDSGLGEIADVLQKDFLGYLWDLNGWDREDGLMPVFTPEKQQFRNIDEIANAIQAIALAGAPVLPNDPMINAFRELMGMPHMPPELVVDAMAVRTATLSEDRLNPGKEPVPGQQKPPSTVGGGES